MFYFTGNEEIQGTGKDEGVNHEKLSVSNLRPAQ
jgi:hypothetical protein